MTAAAVVKRFLFLMQRMHVHPQLTAPAKYRYFPTGFESTPERVQNLVSILEGYFLKGGHHLNVNVVDPAKLRDAMAHPEKYPGLTIRVSGYAVHFHRLTREQQLDVISRTAHGSL